MDPMARTYGKLGPSENLLNWASGRPIMEILEEEQRITHRTGPANDNGAAGYAISRDHSPENLDDWADGVDLPVRDCGPLGPRLVRRR